MNKNIFWIVSIFLISLNVFLFLSNHNFLILAIVLVSSASYIVYNIKKIFLQDQDSNQANITHLINDKADFIIVLLGLFFFILSRLILQYELELLVIGSFFALIKIIRGINSKKKK